MPNSILIPCDGCGQPASPEHIARRLQRLEWATRYRPIHMQTLLLGGISPENDADFLYSPEYAHQGEAKTVLAAAGIETTAKSADILHSEFQRRGMYLTHVLECPLALKGKEHSITDLDALLCSRLNALFTRIRRSLKPRRVVIISEALEPFTARFLAEELGCEVTLDDGHAFRLDNADGSATSQAGSKLQRFLREAAR